jgi:tetratricopeptide (TPR) repeat protein
MAKGRNGDLPAAIADFTEAIRLDPKNAMAYFNRAFARQNKGDLEGAIADYNEVIRLDPKNANAYLNRGLAKTNPGVRNGGKKPRRSEVAAAQKRSAEAMADYTEASRLYTEAIRDDPNNSLAYEYRAAAKDQLGDKDGAAQDRAASARIKEQVASARFREEVAKLSLPELLASSEKTEAIVAAKRQQLPGILRDRKTDELSVLAVKIEQTILDLNHESEVAKDHAQQVTATNGDPKQSDELRGLSISYRERIELLKPIAAAIKDEIANRNR